MLVLSDVSWQKRVVDSNTERGEDLVLDQPKQAGDSICFLDLKQHLGPHNALPKSFLKRRQS